MALHCFRFRLCSCYFILLRNICNEAFCLQTVFKYDLRMFSRNSAISRRMFLPPFCCLLYPNLFCKIFMSKRIFSVGGSKNKISSVILIFVLVAHKDLQENFGDLVCTCTSTESHRHPWEHIARQVCPSACLSSLRPERNVYLGDHVEAYLNVQTTGSF